MTHTRTCDGLCWDLDGTLVNTLTEIAEAANAARSVSALPALPVERIRSMIGDGKDALLSRAVAPLAVEARHHHAFDTTYARSCDRQIELYAGISDVMRVIAQHGIMQSVVTNKPQAYAERIIDAARLRQWCCVVIGGDGPRKPDPAPLRAAMAAMHTTPQRTWMIGDHHTDMHAGRAAGCATMFCTWGFGSRAGCTPDGIVDTPQAILTALRIGT